MLAGPFAPADGADRTLANDVPFGLAALLAARVPVPFQRRHAELVAATGALLFATGRSFGQLVLARRNEAKARSEATQLLSGEDAVLKLIVTRGNGGRGYAAVKDAADGSSGHPVGHPKA